MTEPATSHESRSPAPAGSAAAEGEIDAHAHLRVDEVRDNLRHSSARGGALMIASHAVQLLIGVSGTAVLARLLRPQDFGYLAMVATFTAFVATFRDFGLPMAAVHKQKLSHEQASGLFWINALASVAVAALVAAVAPVLAWFYGEPRLVGITLAMAGGILVHSLSMVHVGLLRRRMNFGAVTVLEVGAMLAGVVVGVAAALAGAGYWALVYQQITIYLAQSSGAVVLCRWRPARPARSAKLARDPELRSMLRYGKDVSVARVVTYVGHSMDAVLVGYFAGPSILGLYQKAYQWSVTPFWQVYAPLTPVAVSSFSRLQDDPPRYRAYARATMLGLFGATLPATALLFVEAEAVVLLLLGGQWVDAIPFFRVLTVGAYFGSFPLVTRWLYLSEGRTAEQLRWALASAPLTVIAVGAGARWGALGIATGLAASMILLTIPGVWYGLRRSPLGWGDFVGAVWRPLVASLVAAGVFVLVRAWIPATPGLILKLALDSAIYLLLYALFWLILPGGRAELRRVSSHLRLLLPSRSR